MKKLVSPKKVGFCSWSGGKDSSLAIHKACSSDKEVRIPFLLNMTGTGNKEGTRGAHGLKKKVFSVQAKSMGRELVQVQTDWDSYERDFKDAVRRMKRRYGVEFGVFGDSELVEHREWVEETCQELDIEVRLPLWGQKSEVIYRDFLESSFEAVLVNLKADLFTKKHLGGHLDQDFLKFLKEENIHLTGEGGEYHSLVIDGPLLDQRLKIKKAKKKEKGDSLQYDILELS